MKLFQIHLRGCLDVIQSELSENLQPLLYVFSIASLLLCIFQVIFIALVIINHRHEQNLERQSRRKIAKLGQTSNFEDETKKVDGTLIAKSYISEVKEHR